MKPKVKYICLDCGKEWNFKNMKFINGNYYCYLCSHNYRHYIKPIGFKGLTIEQAIDKVYTVKFYYHKNTNTISCLCSFPKILAGRKFKVSLIE